MKIHRAYKVELDPNRTQRVLLRKHAGAARFAWNWGLTRRIEEYQSTQRSSRAIEQHRQLNALKKTEYSWLYEVSKCAPQEALRDLDRAFDSFYRRLKLKRQGLCKGPVGFPRFKSKKGNAGSFRLTGHIRVESGRVRLPRLGWIRMKEYGYIPTDRHILSATGSEQAGRWFISILVEEEISVAEATGASIGVDLGVSTLATCSDGRRFANPKPLRRHERRLKRLQRELTRRQKGGKNREKTRLKVARLYYRIGNIRRDALHKTTSAIVAKTKPSQERPAVVTIEDLNVAGMTQDHYLAGAVADASLGEFRRQIEYKADWYGVRLVVADRFYPSSKRCSVCGCVKPYLRLSERVFVCEKCGAVLDRDVNAGRNLAQLSSTVSSTGTHACGEGRLQVFGPVPLEEAGTSPDDPCLCSGERYPGLRRQGEGPERKVDQA